MRINILKTTQTHADVLLAAGVASLLAEAGGDAVDDTMISITSQGPCFVVEGPTPNNVQAWRPSPGYPFIRDAKVDPGGRLPASWPVLDYVEEREKAQQQRQLSKQAGKARKKVEQALTEQEVVIGGPSSTYKIALFMASMRKGWNGDRDLAFWLAHNPEIARAAAARVFHGSFESPDGFIKLSASQMLVPTSGKGVHRPKPDSTAPSAISNALVNPVETWMRLRGLFLSLLSYRAGDDFRIYCLVPGKITLASLRMLHGHMLGKELWGSLRLDIVALLELLRCLVQHSDVMSDAPESIPIRRHRPGDIIQGLTLAVYKSLGTSRALMHAAFLGMPSWFPLEQRADGETYLAFINEAVSENSRGGCLSTLREDNSSDVAILQTFRNWLVEGELALFLDFLVRYGVHTLARRARNEYAREWPTGMLDSILRKGYAMQTEAIISNPGFASVARAIRNATIYSATLTNSRREVRYGLAQEWKQKIKGGPEAFIPVLADFVQQYNWETSHKLEGKGHMVTTEDLDEVIRLIREYGVQVVGMLLLAYGFARAPRVSTEEEMVGDS